MDSFWSTSLAAGQMGQYGPESTGDFEPGHVSRNVGWGSSASLLRGTAFETEPDSLNIALALPDVLDSFDSFPSLSLDSSQDSIWKDQILSIWYENNRRSANDLETVIFRILLKVSETYVKSRLHQLMATPRLCDPSFVVDCQAQFPADPAREPVSDLAATQVAGSSKESFLTTSLQPGGHPAIGMPTLHPTEMLGSHLTPVLENSLDGSIREQTHPVNQINLDPLFCTAAKKKSSKSSGTPKMSATSAQSSKALLKLIDRVKQCKMANGCGTIRPHETQIGRYKCTLGCGRNFKNSADLIRHEEIVFPQTFWFCFQCSSPNDPSERFLFTREDKIRNHISRYHPGNLKPAQTKVLGVHPTLPKSCELCSHYRHNSWKDRSKHIIWHYKRGDSFRNRVSDRRTGPIVSNSNDEDEDDDDEDDDDDDGGNDKNDQDDKDNEDGRDAGPPSTGTDDTHGHERDWNWSDSQQATEDDDAIYEKLFHDMTHSGRRKSFNPLLALFVCQAASMDFRIIEKSSLQRVVKLFDRTKALLHLDGSTISLRDTIEQQRGTMTAPQYRAYEKISYRLCVNPRHSIRGVVSQLYCLSYIYPKPKSGIRLKTLVKQIEEIMRDHKATSKSRRPRLPPSRFAQLGLFRDAIYSPGDFVFVIDGLDECSDLDFEPSRNKHLVVKVPNHTISHGFVAKPRAMNRSLEHVKRSRGKRALDHVWSYSNEDSEDADAAPEG